MFWKRTRRLSLRAQMLAALLPGLLAIIGAELWLTRMDAIEAANGAFDRSLNGAIRSLDLNVSTASGGLSVELPYRLFEFFQLTARGNVYFRVATADGLVEIGSPDLPQPTEAASAGAPVFHDALYFGEPVRVGTFVRPLEQPLGQGGVRQLVIQVAESASSREAFTRSFVMRAALRDALVLSLVGLTLALVVSLLLRPVSRLAEQVSARKPSDLRPLDDADLSSDIRPLVQAVNHQLARTRDLMDRQRLFLDDASHQLRTPLSTLHAQVGYAMRQQDVGELTATLNSIHEQLGQATRSTNQLLALARTDAAPLALERFDLAELVRDVATRVLPLARSKGLDFGVDLGEPPCWCTGDRALLGEAAANLVHNAVEYAHVGGEVTLTAGTTAAGATLGVVNTGHPVPSHVIERLGERFVRSEDSRGSGLGLAIANAIAERHGGTLRVRREGERNVVELTWPHAIGNA